MCVKAYYWRGIAKLKMQNTKGIIDINQSLAVDAHLFQVLVFSMSGIFFCM